MSEEYHQSKIAVLRAVTDVYARHGFHGDNLDIDIDLSFLIVDVHICKREGDNPIDSRQFWVDLQSGSPDTCYDLARRKMEQAMQELGFEFTTIEQAQEEANGSGL